MKGCGFPTTAFSKTQKPHALGNMAFRLSTRRIFRSKQDNIPMVSCFDLYSPPRLKVRPLNLYVRGVLVLQGHGQRLHI
jgi:hypothetical protein